MASSARPWVQVRENRARSAPSTRCHARMIAVLAGASGRAPVTASHPPFMPALPSAALRPEPEKGNVPSTHELRNNKTLLRIGRCRELNSPLTLEEDRVTVPKLPDEAPRQHRCGARRQRSSRAVPVRQPRRQNRRSRVRERPPLRNPQPTKISSWCRPSVHSPIPTTRTGLRAVSSSLSPSESSRSS